MSKFRITNFQRVLQNLLRDTDLDWRIENGKKHRKLYIEEEMVMVFSHGPCTHNDMDRVRSFIRRAKEAKNADRVGAV